MPVSRRARWTPASPRTSSPRSGPTTRRSTRSTTPTSSGPGGAKPLRDVGGPGLAVLFAGINPSLRSAEVGHHFARPGNRFWPALHLAGFTPRRFAPEEDGELPRYGVGITNLVDRPTRAAAELTRDELREGAAALAQLVGRWQPRLLAVVGLTAWRTAFDRPGATIGLQEDEVGGRPVCVLPNPSGLNAHYQLPDLARLYGEARELALSLDPTRPAGAASPAPPRR